MIFIITALSFEAFLCRLLSA